jgi:Pyruvate/2-oxoacid:ferredoxin oxidoreductase gamma subunit
MHDAYAAPILEAVRPGGVILLNAEVGAPALDRDRYLVVEIAATEIADGVGNRMTASMVIAGAYAAATDLVSLDSLCSAVAESLPPYRQKLAEVNVAALRAGFEAAPRSVAPAWEPEREPAR